MLDRTKLIPYVSAGLATGKGRVTNLHERVLDDIEHVLGEVSGGSRVVIDRLTSSSDKCSQGTLLSCGFAYTLEKPPGWGPDTGFADITHQLVVVCRRSRSIGI